MSALLPVYIFFVVLLLVMPPVSLIVAAVKRARRPLFGFGVPLRISIVALCCVPLILNLIYIASAWRDIVAAQISVNFALGFAIVVSWACLWGRVAIRRFGRHKRYVSY